MMEGVNPQLVDLKEKAEGFDEVRFVWDAAAKCFWVARVTPRNLRSDSHHLIATNQLNPNSSHVPSSNITVISSPELLVVACKVDTNSQASYPL